MHSITVHSYDTCVHYGHPVMVKLVVTVKLAVMVVGAVFHLLWCHHDLMVLAMTPLCLLQMTVSVSPGTFPRHPAYRLSSHSSGGRFSKCSLRLKIPSLTHPLLSAMPHWPLLHLFLLQWQPPSCSQVRCCILLLLFSLCIVRWTGVSAFGNSNGGCMYVSACGLVQVYM